MYREFLHSVIDELRRRQSPPSGIIKISMHPDTFKALALEYCDIEPQELELYREPQTFLGMPVEKNDQIERGKFKLSPPSSAREGNLRALVTG